MLLGLIITILAFAFFGLMFLFSIIGYFENRIEGAPVTRSTFGMLFFFLFDVIQALAIYVLYKKWRGLKIT